MGLTLTDPLNPFMKPALVSNETVPAQPAHLISILPAIARLLLIGWEIDMQHIRGGHYRFFFFFNLTVWTANEKGHRGEMAILNEREVPNKQEKLRMGRKCWGAKVGETCGNSYIVLMRYKFLQFFICSMHLEML